MVDELSWIWCVDGRVVVPLSKKRELSRAKRERNERVERNEKKLRSSGGEVVESERSCVKNVIFTNVSGGAGVVERVSYRRRGRVAEM